MATAKTTKTTAAAGGRKKAVNADAAKTAEPKAEIKAAPKKSVRKPSRAKVYAGGGAANGGPKATPGFSEQVRRLAYQFWEERGRPEGSSNEDWYRAEKQLSETSN